MSWCHDGKTVFSLKNMHSAPVQKRKKMVLLATPHLLLRHARRRQNTGSWHSKIIQPWLVNQVSMQCGGAHL
jgi:hypothetical protein